MFSFEGDYKRKPVQSMRGASIQHETSSLLRKNQEERDRRENQRKRITSAILIQSQYRGYCIRKEQKRQQRAEFDKIYEAVTKTTCQTQKQILLCDLARRLIYCYTASEDSQRLTGLCQLFLKERKSVSQSIAKNDKQVLYHIQNLINLCSRHLDVIASGSEPIAVPMRMLETYLDPKVFYREGLPDIASQIVEHILDFIIRRGFFKHLRKLLEWRVPSSLEKSVRAPTPVAASIYDLILKPIKILPTITNSNTRHSILQLFSQELLCQPYSEQISLFLLPALSSRPDQFPFKELLHSLIQKDKSDLSVTPSPWLLNAVLQLSVHHLDSLSKEDIRCYLRILQLLLPLLPSISRYDYEDSDNEEEIMLTDAMETGEGLDYIIEQCTECLRGEKFLQCVTGAVNTDPTPPVILAICTICHTLMTKHKFTVHRDRLLYMMAYNAKFIRSLWQLCVSMTTTIATGTQTPLLQVLSRGLPMSTEDRECIVPVLSLFCSLFCTSILTLHDAEFFSDDTNSPRMAFTLSELVPISLMLRDACLGIVELAHPDSKPSLREEYSKVYKDITGGRKLNTSGVTKEEVRKQRETWAYLFRVTEQLVKQLYARDSRRNFCPPDHWLSIRFNIQADKMSQIYRAQNSVFVSRPFGALSFLNQYNAADDDGPPLSNTEVRNLQILTEIPFVVPFGERVKIFHKLLSNDKQENQGENHNFMTGPFINVMIRRNFLYEDAFEKLSVENEPNLKLKMRVQLVNAAGLDEAGIDGGGIFREFLSELIKTGFDPNRGFFQTTMDRTLCPSPHSHLLVENFTQHYFFLGRILGKAMYDNMLVELPFAGFFLSKILNRHSGDVDIHHLASLDPEMYKNLLFMKNYSGDVSDLDLDFTVTTNHLGQSKVEELVPGGQDIAVDNYNRIEYIHRMADYRLNKQIRAQTHAFRQGLADVINLEWLRMFDQQELQTMISGAHVPIDLDDLKANTNYSGGYSADHHLIKTFWKVIETFDENEKRSLLKFVTSCSRPPLLGFKDLYPAFCVQFGGSEMERLPTASTCMNLLKLPEFKDEETMRNKLLYAIQSGAGFELS